MEYQKVINLLDDTANQPSKFWTRNWGKINDESRGTYSKGNQSKFKTSMIRSNLCGYSDAYILVSVTIKIRGEWDNDAAKRAGGRIKGVIFKNCASFTGCISNITK